MPTLSRVGQIGARGSRGSGVAAFSPLGLFDAAQVGGWYDPSDLSTLWQDTAGTVPVTTDGQTVLRIDDKSANGLHLTQATNGPTYRTSGGLHWLEFVAANSDWLLSAATVTLGPLPLYGAFAFQRSANGAQVMFGIVKDTTNYARFLNAGSLERIQVALRSTAKAAVVATTPGAQVPLDTDIFAEGRWIAGNQYIKVATAAAPDTAETSGTNVWTTDTVASCAIGIGATTTAASSAISMRFYGGVLIHKAPSTGERAAMKLWMGAKMGINFP